MYSPAVIEHAQHPHNMGDLPGATHTVSVTNPVCGDELTVAVRIDAGRIADVKFRSRGCKAAIASASVLTDWMMGKSLDEIREITAEKISQQLGGLPAATRHGSQLAEEALDSILDKL
jgi:nitrogen fixation NifU-like protein